MKEKKKKNNCPPAPKGQKCEAKKERENNEQFRQRKGAKNITSPANFSSKFQFDVNPNMQAAAAATQTKHRAEPINFYWVETFIVRMPNTPDAIENRLCRHRHHIRALGQSYQINIEYKRACLCCHFYCPFPVNVGVFVLLLYWTIAIGRRSAIQFSHFMRPTRTAIDDQPSLSPEEEKKNASK